MKSARWRQRADGWTPRMGEWTEISPEGKGHNTHGNPVQSTFPAKTLKDDYGEVKKKYEQQPTLLQGSRCLFLILHDQSSTNAPLYLSHVPPKMYSFVSKQGCCL